MTEIQILDSNLNYITKIQSPYPLDAGGDILRYSKELSQFGQCTFRISSYDTAFTLVGDIIQPHKYHVRIVRGGTTVWQGAVIENPKRTRDYIEVVAAQYLWYLGKLLINRSSNNPGTGAADSIYRIFSSRTQDNATPSTTMGQAVTDIMNETIAKYATTNHALASLAIGTIQNPNFPPNITDGNGNPLTGPWKFGDGITAPLLQFDFHSTLYVLKSFGVYTYADFNIDENLKFNFKSFLGNDLHTDVNFTWGDNGNAEDFNAPRLGQRQVNHLWGIAVTPDGVILHNDQANQTAIVADGILEEVQGYSDVKDQATLNARVEATLPLLSTADAAAKTFVLSEKAYPLGVYDIGDIVTVNVNHVAVQLSQITRVVGISVALHSTGRELTTVQTNVPLPWQVGA